MSDEQQKTNRREDAESILLKHILNIDPKFNETNTKPTLLSLIKFFALRNKKSTEELTEVNKITVQTYCEILKDIINEEYIKKVCCDESFINVLIEFVEEKINPSVIIQAILNSDTITDEELNRSRFELEIDATLDDSKYYSFTKEGKDRKEISEQEKTLEQSILATPAISNSNFKSSTGIPNLENNRTCRDNSTVMMNTTIGQVRNLSIKDALDLIPRYNGINIPLSEFADGCKEIVDIFSNTSENEFVKFIKIRLYGEALKSVSKKQFNTVDELLKFFDSIFGSHKTFHELHGKLASVKQKRDESVIVFSNRIKTIGQEISAAATREHRFVDNLEKDMVMYFLRGLLWVIKARMGKVKNLEQATKEAIEIERDFACYEPGEITEPLNSVSQNQEKQVEKIRLIDNQQREICQFCEKIGHTAKRCWKIRPPGEQERRNTWDTIPNFRVRENNKNNYENNRNNWGNRNNQSRKWEAPPNQNRDFRNQGYVQRQNVTFANNRNQSNQIICRYCKKPGHQIEVCRKREFNNKKIAQENETHLREMGASKEINQQQRPSTSYQREI